MLNSIIPNNNNHRQNETFSDGYFCGIDTNDGFMALIIMVVSWIYMYPQTHQVIYIKYVQLFISQSYLNKMILQNQTSYKVPHIV